MHPYPKLHSMHHMMVRLRDDATSLGYSQNCLATSCQLDEDLIGKVSRLSRRVSIRATAERTLGRYLVAAHSAWRDAGLIK